MHRIPAHSLQVLLCTTALVAAPPALAQDLAPKDAFVMLEAFVTGAGGGLTIGEMVRDGEAVVAPDAVLRLGDGLEARFEALRFEPRGAEAAMIAPGGFTIATTQGPWREYVVQPDGEFRLALSGADMALGLDFAQLGVTSPTAPAGEALTMTFAGLTGRFGLTLTEPHQLDGTLRADRLDYDLTMSDPAIQLNQRAVSRTEDMDMTLSMAGLRAFVTEPGWVARAFADGFGARFTARAGRAESDIDQTIGGTRTLIRSVVASSSAEIALTEGALTLDSAADGIEMSVQVPGVIGGQGTLARLAMGLEMPVIRTQEDRRFGARLALQELRIDPQLLTMIGAQEFADDAASVEIDLHGDGRWLVEITDDPDPREQPIDFSTMALNALTAQLGAAALTGSGAFALAPGALAQAGDGPPDGEGDFTFQLRGGEALLTRLTAAGLLPPEQQFAARAFIGVLGRPVGEDHLQSDISIRPGGQITVNGAPVPF